MAVPLISVISVTFNALDDLRKTADSVWAQDYKNLEFVVIDGASVDGTAEWLRECCRISGRNKTLGGTLEYIGQSIEVGFNKLYRFVIPSSLIKKIRALNYRRK